jgi:hypothetical protein
VRAVTGRPVKIRFRLEDEGGTLVAADDSTTVDVTVADGAGVQLATGTATAESTGLYVFTLPAQTQLDVLTATATATLDGAQTTVTETVRLVGRRIVPLSVLRRSTDLADLSVPDFLRAVDEAEDWLTSCLEFSPVRTGERRTFREKCVTARLQVPGIYFPEAPYSLSFDGNPYNTEQLATMTVRAHAIEFDTAYFYGGYDPILGAWGPSWQAGVYDVHLAHGMSETPSDLSRAAAKLAEHCAKQIGYPDRATRIMTEASEIWFSTPDGEKRLTGIPEVDGIIIRHRITSPFSEDSGSF